MSSSVGYYLSAADAEANRRRELRARIAAERAKLHAVRRRAAAVGVQVTRGADKHRGTGQNITSADLDAELAALRDEAQDAQRCLDAGLTKRLTDRINRSAPAVAERTAAAGQPTHHATAAPSVDIKREQRARAATFRDAQVLLTRSVSRCDSVDVPELTELVERMVRTESLRQMRTDAVTIAVRIKESVERRKAADAVAEKRARLVSLLADALHDEREALVDAVSRADDPAGWEAAVHEAIHRADLVTERHRVAAAAMSALAGAGCALGDDFATLLIEHNEVIVPLPHEPEHGVLVRLPADGTRLTAAVVRANKEPSENDTAAQRTFCTEILHHLEDEVRAAGIELTQFVRRQPGQYPVAPAPASDWSRANGHTAAQTQQGPRRVQLPMRERHRGD